MENFHSILFKYSLDQGTDKDTAHSYGRVYEKHLKEFEGRNNLTILEIGIGNGSFLQVLHEIFPNATIYGVDIDLSYYRYDKSNSRIHLFQMDGTQESTADYLNQCFDLIIEDASHLPHDQKETLDVFAPYLKKNGMYVLEDIVHGNEVLKKDLETIGYKHHLTMEWIDLTAMKQRKDDILAIFKRNY